MHLKIKHRTEYTFDAPIHYGLQQVRLTPKSTRNQTVLSWETRVSGGSKQVTYDDFHRNRVDLVGMAQGATKLTLDSEGEVEVLDSSGVVGPHQGATPLWLFEQPTARTSVGPGIRALTRNIAEEDPIARLHALSACIGEAVVYEVGASEPDWTAEQALEAGKGVCQDHTHVFVSAARHMGYPSRYVSGYLMMNDRVVQEATHAWAEAYVKGVGWIGFDVSNRISPDTRYVRVATGRDYAEAAPVRGTRMGGEGEALSVTVEVAQQ